MNKGMSADHRFAINLMKHMVVPTFVLDSDGKVIIWNDACARLTGVSAEEVVGTRNHRQAFYGEPRPCLADLIVEGNTEELSQLYADFDEDSSTETGFHAENWCKVPKIEGRFYLHIDAGPIFNQSGELLAVVETLRDMTAQKEAQLALERLASSDGLTGLANRRVFDSTLEDEWRRAQRASYPVSVLMIDVDHFKGFNDTYGHQQGDSCLREVAQVLEGSAARTGDLVARYGGEEFVLILPATKAEDALTVAERIRADVEALKIPNASAGADQSVTISTGVATCSLVSTTPESLVASADKALYRAKDQGRNRVEVFAE